MKQIRKRLTYANVMSTIAVFLVIGGASAFAATELGKKSVGTKQLKPNAVTSAKIKKEAVGSAKIKNGAVTGGKLANGAISANQLGADSVTADKLAANSVTAGKLASNSVESTKIAKEAVTNEKIANNAVNGSKVADGSLTGADIDQASLTAVKAANVYGVTFQEVGGPKIINASDPGIKSGGCFLVCSVEFPRDVTECSYTTSPIDQDNGSGVPAITEAFPSSNDNAVLVAMFDDEGTLIAHDWAMTVVCPTTS